MKLLPALIVMAPLILTGCADISPLLPPKIQETGCYPKPSTTDAHQKAVENITCQARNQAQANENHITSQYTHVQIWNYSEITIALLSATASVYSTSIYLLKGVGLGSAAFLTLRNTSNPSKIEEAYSAGYVGYSCIYMQGDQLVQDGYWFLKQENKNLRNETSNAKNNLNNVLHKFKGQIPNKQQIYDNKLIRSTDSAIHNYDTQKSEYNNADKDIFTAMTDLGALLTAHVKLPPLQFSNLRAAFLSSANGNVNSKSTPTYSQLSVSEILYMGQLLTTNVETSTAEESRARKRLANLLNEINKTPDVRSHIKSLYKCAKVIF